jgi:hypothetical protein
MKGRQISFEHAWKIALQRVRWPHDKQSRQEWKDALISTKKVWDDCYHDQGNRIDIERFIDALAARATR